MSTPQPQRAPTDSSASNIAEVNRSYAKLVMELDKDVELLKFLPSNRETFQEQYELKGAARHRLLYGDMMEEKDQLWIYFTLLGRGDNYNSKTGGNRMIMFYKLKSAQAGGPSIRPNNVQGLAQASQPFKYAKTYYQVMVSVHG
jgi:hypothetical protein